MRTLRGLRVLFFCRAVGAAVCGSGGRRDDWLGVAPDGVFVGGRSFLNL